jgi:UDP-glucose 4-epimerase
MTNSTLIIGGAGFIGSHLVDVCLAADHQVWVYDNFSVGKKEFLPEHKMLHIIEGDILDSTGLSNLIGDCTPDLVYHLAAIHHIPTCERMPERALRVNIEGTNSVLSACAHSSVSRIVFASTGALYDPASTGALAETTLVKAFDIYSISKLAGEHLMQYHVSKNDSQAVIARLFNTVGRRETNQHIIPMIMDQLAAGVRQIKLGNLHPRRDYVHVEDVAEALFELGEIHLAEPSDIFNIGSGVEYSVQEIVELCAEIIGESVDIISVPNLQRKVDRPNQLANLTKIQQITSWKPKRTIKQALSEVWQDYQAKVQLNNNA